MWFGLLTSMGLWLFLFAILFGLRGFAQRDPLLEYKREAFDLFQTMLGQLREVVTTYLAQILPILRHNRNRRKSLQTNDDEVFGRHNWPVTARTNSSSWRLTNTPEPLSSRRVTAGAG